MISSQHCLAWLGTHTGRANSRNIQIAADFSKKPNPKLIRECLTRDVIGLEKH
jgi:hypothetical protein